MANLFQLIRSSINFVISQLLIDVSSSSCLMNVFPGLVFLHLLCNNSRKITSQGKFLLTLVHVWSIKWSLISSWFPWYTRCSWMQIASTPYYLADATSLFWFSSELNGASVKWRWVFLLTHIISVFGGVSVRYLSTPSWSLTEESSSSSWTITRTMNNVLLSIN